MTQQTTPTPVLWSQVGGLALVQGAITLMWVIYNLYLVQLLTQVGWSQSMALALLIVENALAIMMEPLMGSVADHWRRWAGTQLPVIALGVILATGFFLAIPLMALGGLAQIRWLLPLMMVLWALSMTVFRSPVLSLLGQYAIESRLPQATSLLTLIGCLAGSMQPLANQIILGWGPVATFAIGSGVLVGASLVLRRCQPNQTLLDNSSPAPARTRVSWPSLGLIFGLGATVSLGFRCLMLVFPKSLLQHHPNLAPGLFLGLLFATQAVTALPAGTLAVRVGNLRLMGVGLLTMAPLCLMAGVVQQIAVGIGLTIAIGIAFTPVLNGTIPFALSLVPPGWFGLGTGLYFSGAALANCLAGSWLARPDTGMGLQRLVGCLMFLGAALCVGLSQRISKR